MSDPSAVAFFEAASIEELKKEFKGLKCIPHHAPKRGAPIDRYTFKFQATDQIPGQTTVNDYLESLNNPKRPTVKKNNFTNYEQKYTSAEIRELEEKFLDN